MVFLNRFVGTGEGGRNYGWRNREGATSRPPAFTPLIDPITSTIMPQGGSITGGWVYRGSSLGAGFRGRYFFADFIRSRVWSIALPVDAAGDARASDVREHTADLGGASQLAGVSSFGLDAAGELFVVSHTRGVVLTIVGPPPTPGTLRIIR